jgi:hypothetical protein
MKYIFVTGAPGSKWSSVVKNIYFSRDIDQSDSNVERQYNMHQGAYWDPGMEFDLPENMQECSKHALEGKFDAPFNGFGIRIIKSHIFSLQLDFIRETWPECPIVLVHRPDDACLDWWIEAGQFNITYPNYKPYYQDIDNMAVQITKQNTGILKAMDLWSVLVHNNQNLCNVLNITIPPTKYYQIYAPDILVRCLT